MVRLLPSATFDPEIAGNGPWEIAGVLFDENPRDLVDNHTAEVANAWIDSAEWHYPSMGGAPSIIGHRPMDSGGHGDQAAIILDYFRIMDGFGNAILREQSKR